MTVIIGFDPPQESHTAVAICSEERALAKVTVQQIAKHQLTTRPPLTPMV
jgi:hypothetical protein